MLCIVCVFCFMLGTEWCAATAAVPIWLIQFIIFAIHAFSQNTFLWDSLTPTLLLTLDDWYHEDAYMSCDMVCKQKCSSCFKIWITTWWEKKQNLDCGQKHELQCYCFMILMQDPPLLNDQHVSIDDRAAFSLQDLSNEKNCAIMWLSISSRPSLRLAVWFQCCLTYSDKPSLTLTCQLDYRTWMP